MLAYIYTGAMGTRSQRLLALLHSALPLDLVSELIQTLLAALPLDLVSELIQTLLALAFG